jgi:hypothetical protein
MKQISYFLILSFLNISIFSQTDILILNNKVGNIELNMPFPSILPKGFTNKTEQKINFYEGQRYVNYVINVIKDNKLVLNCIIEENKVLEIEIFDLFRTKENIGVGSSLIAFLKAYPDYQIWYSIINDLVVVESETVKGQFIIDKKFLIYKHQQKFKNESVSQHCDRIRLKQTDFMLDATIKSILIM